MTIAIITDFYSCCIYITNYIVTWTTYAHTHTQTHTHTHTQTHTHLSNYLTLLHNIYIYITMYLCVHVATLIAVVVVVDGSYFVLSLVDSVWWPIFSRITPRGSRCWVQPVLDRSILHWVVSLCEDDAFTDRYQQRHIQWVPVVHTRQLFCELVDGWCGNTCVYTTRVVDRKEV